ncbi:MAG: hypothetical protein AB7L92_04975 [Alphaproteobacteria bacterium]
MKLSAAEQEEITKLLTRIYQDILAIETDYELRTGNGDARCRIEYFHDAIRAFFSGNVTAQRLQVELLAYDLKCLRYVADNPFAPFTPDGGALSPKTDLVVNSAGLVAQSKKPDRSTRERLSELYKHYAVLFAALLKLIADNDYEERTHNLNEDVREIHEIMQTMQKLGISASDIEHMIAQVNHIDDGQLRNELMAFVQAGKARKPDEIKKLLGYLKNRISQKDKQIATIDKAHLEYATNQLALYEAAKDMLKSLARGGMNLVGKFVETSIAQARREMGR